MAIVFDAASTGAQNTVSSLTVSHTCTGSDLILFVGVQTADGTDRISGITYAGAAMTRINTQQSGGTGNHRCYLYYKLAPATGANNIVITATAEIGYIRCANASYTGALQSGVPDAQNTKTDTAVTTTALSTTTIADNCWVVSAESNDQGTGSAWTGTTERGTPAIASVNIGDNNAPKTPAGAVSLGWQTVANADFAVCNASFAPVAETTTSTSTSSSTSTTSTSTSSSTSTTSTSTSTSSSSSSSTSTTSTSTSTTVSLTTSTSTTSTSTSSSSSSSTSTTSTSTSTSSSSSTSTTSTSTSSSSSTSTSTTTTLDYHFYIDNEGAARNLSIRVDHGEE